MRAIPLLLVVLMSLVARAALRGPLVWVTSPAQRRSAPVDVRTLPSRWQAALTGNGDGKAVAWLHFGAPVWWGAAVETQRPLAVWMVDCDGRVAAVWRVAPPGRFVAHEAPVCAVALAPQVAGITAAPGDVVALEPRRRFVDRAPYGDPERLLSRLRPHRNDPQVALVAAGLEYRVGKVDAAIRHWRRLARRSDLGAAPWSALARALANRGDVAAAREAFGEWMMRFPDSDAAFGAAWRFAKATGGASWFVGQVRAVRTAHPQALAPLLALVRAALAVGDRDQARAVLAQMRPQTPGQAALRSRAQGWVALAAGDVQEAAAAFAAYLAAFPYAQDAAELRRFCATFGREVRR